MLFLDTNAFYYASGLEQNTKVNISLIKDYIQKNDTAISSVSLFEFLTRYKDKIDIIHQGGNFLIENSMKVQFNKYFPLPDKSLEYIKRISHISSQELEELYKIVIANRIKTESLLTSVVFQLCFFSYCYFVCYNTEEDYTDLTWDILCRLNELVMQMALIRFEEIYTKGYNEKSCENYVRDKFYEFMASICRFYIPLLEQAVNSKEIITVEEFLNKEINWTDLIAKQTQKMKDSNKSTKYIEKMARKYRKKASDEKWAQFSIKLKKSIQKSIKETALQNYLCDITYNCCTQSGAFYKNDVLDAIITCNVQSDNILITFDKGCIKHMEKYEADSVLYQQSLSSINSLLLTN